MHLQRMALADLETQIQQNPDWNILITTAVISVYIALIRLAFLAESARVRLTILATSAHSRQAVRNLLPGSSGGLVCIAMPGGHFLFSVM
ncbi:hypothetical protein EDB19DRAFT_1150082 [Suillus lakei]|nr:hypothetical protein EDB19DRAFT_1150082 [Suillus lakei]